MDKVKKRIVVMGGSFNPPTLAHYRLMTTALNALNADFGFFVPVSDAYLKRKMHHAHPPVVLSPELRVAMLQTLCTDSRMAVCKKELGTVEPQTMPTLCALQEDYPDAELFFLMGADKLDLLVHMAEKRGFLDLFSVVLYSRDGEATAEVLSRNEVLSCHRHRIVTLAQPTGTEGISSSAVRERMLAGLSCQDMLCPGVWELFKDFTPADFPEMIDKFRGEYDFLNNRFPCDFEWQGLRYGSAEAAFQASKCTKDSERKVLASCLPDRAALKGKDIVPPEGWEEARPATMAAILRAKFSQNPALMEKLKATGRSILVNGNNKHDTYWGVDLYSWQGENHLGEILMAIRGESS